MKKDEQTPLDQPSQSETPTQYSVSAPDANLIDSVPAITTDLVGEPKKRIAIFVAHGMGQQIPFETLDSIAESLRTHDSALTGQTVTAVSNSIKAEDQWLPRIELGLKSGNVEAHIYEAYWAPLTEGRINIRQVMGFLSGAGSNGLQVARKTFRRWLMGKYEVFPTPIRVVVYLILALATMGSLVVMNSTIAIVAAARALFVARPWWLSDGLFADLTTTFDGVVTAMAVFGVSLTIGHVMRGRLPVLIRRIWSWVTIFAFVLATFAIVLAGVSVVALFFLHIRGGVAPTTELWQNCFSKTAIDGFNRLFDLLAAWAIILIAAGVLAGWMGVVLVRFVRDVTDRPNRLLTLAAMLAFVLLVATIGVLIDRCLPLLNAPGGVAALRHGVAWPLLIVASAFVRSVLVQYVGDVAIYVMPYKLDAFNDLRKEIKDTVYKVAHAVYAMKDDDGELEYESIIVLGHSLGSVIAYDALNRLIQEDGAGTPPNALEVVARTPLFLTFGSPLDKTAFIFGAQGHATTEAREALAASVQPLIQDYKYRPKQWVNIYSPWDIISGALDLYDLPGT
ncbi:MAG TPA: hypothetical protein VGG76_08290, partial [Gemmatimonadaceae bacterium]